MDGNITKGIGNALDGTASTSELVRGFRGRTVGKLQRKGSRRTRGRRVSRSIAAQT